MTINNITDSIAESIIKYNSDTFADISETIIDKGLKDGIFKELPIVQLLYGVSNTLSAIKKNHELKKFILFINKLNMNGVDNTFYEDYKEKLKNNDEYKFKELEKILLIIDKYFEVQKSEYLANLYFNYIDKKMSWDEFLELSIIVSNLYISDIKELDKIYKKGSIKIDSIENKISLKRLIYQVIVEQKEKNLVTSRGEKSGKITSNICSVTELGKKLCDFGIYYKK